MRLMKGIGICAVGLGFVIIFSLLLEKVLPNFKTSAVPEKEPVTKPRKTRKQKIRKCPGFWEIVEEWLIAKKRKICPIITFQSVKD
jgi:hypothetical protein